MQYQPMPILTVRLSRVEQKTLLRRAKQAKKKKATFVRELIVNEPFETGADIMTDLQGRMGDSRLAIAPRK